MSKKLYRPTHSFFFFFFYRVTHTAIVWKNLSHVTHASRTVYSLQLQPRYIPVVVACNFTINYHEFFLSRASKSAEKPDRYILRHFHVTSACRNLEIRLIFRINFYLNVCIRTKSPRIAFYANESVVNVLEDEVSRDDAVFNVI